mmetsp:Transcript_8383/g.20888  ORF Transcript_8383/g.20888 Transcript_8383/m.20888 type:complete len:232 (-) Transcript_8383:365-1060(-)
MAPLMTSPMDVDVTTSPSFKTRNIPTKASSRVSFCNEVRVYRHIHLNDMEEYERAGAWYSQEELKTVKAECNRTVRKMMRDTRSPYEHCLSPSSASSTSSNGSTSSFRGLEFRTPDGANMRRANKENAWDKVLDEQESQYLSGDFDDEAIARIYRDVSKHCQEAAHLLGLSDSYAARQEERNDEDNEQMKAKDLCGDAKQSLARHENRHLRRMVFNLANHPRQSEALSTVA